MMTRQARILGTTLGMLIGLALGVALLAARDHVAALGQSPAAEGASAETETPALCQATDPLPAGTETPTPAGPPAPPVEITAAPSPQPTTAPPARETPAPTPTPPRGQPPAPRATAGPYVSPTAEPTIVLSVDTDPTMPGIQTKRTVRGGTFTVDIVVSGLPISSSLAAFNLELVYDQTVLQAPTLGAPVSALDRNLDVNQQFLNSTGHDFECGGVPPCGDADPDPAVGRARLLCTSIADAPAIAGEGVLASVTFQVVGSGTVDLRLERVAFYDTEGNPLGRCPGGMDSVADCRGASVEVLADR